MLHVTFTHMLSSCYIHTKHLVLTECVFSGRYSWSAHAIKVSQFILSCIFSPAMAYPIVKSSQSRLMSYNVLCTSRRSVWITNSYRLFWTLKKGSILAIILILMCTHTHTHTKEVTFFFFFLSSLVKSRRKDYIIDKSDAKCNFWNGEYF